MKTALLFGSSGLIGGHLLNKLVQNNSYNKIKIFVREQPNINDSKNSKLLSGGTDLALEVTKKRKDLESIIRKLNPINEKGKIILICRFGMKKIDKELPPLIKMINKNNFKNNKN